jgi:activating signal cointegrator 1
LAQAGAGFLVPGQDLPLGAIIAVAHLHRVGRIGTNGDGQITIVGHDLPLDPESPEAAFGDYADGRYAWVCTNVRPLPEPIPCRGALGLWDVPAEIAARLEGWWA